MLKYGNRDFRNLQEQVYANMKNIQDIIDGSSIIADLNVLHIVGTADTAEELPDPDTYAGKYGDAIAVGTAEPYDLYIFSKAYSEENAPQWFNIGEFPQPGPQGPKGDKGDTGVGIPEIEAGDAGKALIVNEAETDAVWGDVGLSPEDQAKLDNSLQLPARAPASQVIVGVNTSKEQNALGIGDGLELDNGAVKAKVGDGLQIVSGTIKAKVGTGVEIDDNGALSANIPDVLVLPESAPAEQKIVSINTSREQANLGLGDSLVIENGKLNANALILDFGVAGGVLYISKTIGDKILARGFDYIIAKNISNNNRHFQLLSPAYDTQATATSGTGIYRSGLINLINKQPSSNNMEPTMFGYQVSLNCSLYGPHTGDDDYYQVTVSGSSTHAEYLNHSFSGGTLSGTSGTINSTWSSWVVKGSWKHFQMPYVSPVTGNYLPIRWQVVKSTGSTSNTVWVGEAVEFNLTEQTYTTYRITLNGLSYTVTQVITDNAKIASAKVYDVAAETTDLGTFDIYQDANGLNFIKVSNALSAVTIDGSNVETALTATISDYKTGLAPVIKLLVKNNGTNYYIAGLYESARIKVSFTKPTDTVNGIALKLGITNDTTYYFSPSILFGGSAIINCIPVQYIGIVRSSITAIDTGNASFIKLSGSPITFGSDATVEFDININAEVVNGIINNL